MRETRSLRTFALVSFGSVMGCHGQTSAMSTEQLIILLFNAYSLIYLMSL